MRRELRPTRPGFYWVLIDGWTIGEFDHNGEGYLVGSDVYQGHENDSFWDQVRCWIPIPEPDVHTS